MKVTWTATDIELAVAKHLNPRANLIVPNVSWGWGFHIHEADLIVLRQSGWATEIEIKVTRGDVKADLRKRCARVYGPWADDKVAFKWFAVPDGLGADALIPKDYGIMKVRMVKEEAVVTTTRAPRKNPRARRVTPEERSKLAELAAMRIWDLKRALQTAKMRVKAMKGGDK